MTYGDVIKCQNCGKQSRSISRGCSWCGYGRPETEETTVITTPDPVVWIDHELPPKWQTELVEVFAEAGFKVGGFDEARARISLGSTAFGEPRLTVESDDWAIDVPDDPVAAAWYVAGWVDRHHYDD